MHNKETEEKEKVINIHEAQKQSEVKVRINHRWAGDHYLLSRPEIK